MEDQGDQCKVTFAQFVSFIAHDAYCVFVCEVGGGVIVCWTPIPLPVCSIPANSFSNSAKTPLLLFPSSSIVTPEEVLDRP
jgi:hypothetical protein